MSNSQLPTPNAKPRFGLRSGIAAGNVQELFESAANAADKGQAQWFTPPDWARVLAIPLCQYRPHAVDLTCGNGQLLAGVLPRRSSARFGCDIDPSAFSLQPSAFNFVTADVTKLYPLLRAVHWQADVFALNPPWDLHWYRAEPRLEPGNIPSPLPSDGRGEGQGEVRGRLSALAQSDCPAVAAAFAAHDGRVPRECIDSTVATLCFALDCMSQQGEGFLIANEATLQRLIFAPGAPHKALADHIWAHLVIAGNICQPPSPPGEGRGEGGFKTGIIYFARAHIDGVKIEHRIPSLAGAGEGRREILSQAQAACEEFRASRLTCRKGPEPKEYSHTRDTETLWLAAAEEYNRLYSTLRTPHSALYNLWLSPYGSIRTALSLFDKSSGRVDNQMAGALFALNGKQPIQLVLQRSQRKALEAAVGMARPTGTDGNGGNGGPTGTVWRVDPRLMAAVAEAIRQYDAVRSPLYPLPAIQRLGYLDELDEIKCCRSLASPSPGGEGRGEDGRFIAGKTYPIRSCTVAVNRQGARMNVHGLTEDVEWDGQELALFITDEAGVERCFMEERLRAGGVKINVLKSGVTRKRRDSDIEAEECPIDFTLQQLAAHFIIPDVPDVAARFPEQYKRNLDTLAQIERLVAAPNLFQPAQPIAAFGFKPFQREDYARAALQDGVVLGHDTGLGKTIAEFIWPLLKLGLIPSPIPSDGRGEGQGEVRASNRLVPARPVLLVVPGDGHDQTDDESFLHFKTRAVRLDSQEKFLKLSVPNGGSAARRLPPAFYITSYTQLSGNGVAEFPKLNRARPEATMRALNLTEKDAADWFDHRAEIYRHEYERLGFKIPSPLPSDARPTFGGGEGQGEVLLPTWKQIEAAWKKLRKSYLGRESDAYRNELDTAYYTLQKITPQPGASPAGYDASPSPGEKVKPSRGSAGEGGSSSRRFNPVQTPNSELRTPNSSYGDLSADQQQFIRSELAIRKHREFSQNIGLTRTIAIPEPPDDNLPISELRTPNSELPSSICGTHKVKCVYSPSLADLSGDCFGAIVVDEGTKMKGEATEISLGVRQINAPYRLVMTGTPVKNRFPDVFRLAHFVCGGHEEPTARFPYGEDGRDQFAEDFMVSERNLTKEANSESGRRFRKLTAQVCNIHRAWKLLAPIILRRRKEACGEDIVPKRRHVVRVPLGLYQAACYQFHLNADYRDCNGQKAVGAQLQALRIAAANPASELLRRPDGDGTAGTVRSRFTYVPKVATACSLVAQILQRGEQGLIGSAFQDSLDALSARLREAGVKHLVLDGRVSQKKRAGLAREFKQGPPRAIAEGLTSRCSQYPILLAGVECMAELHSFQYCNNVLLMAYSWAFDKFEQFINRAHRLNSPWPVDVWSLVCEGSIDRKLESGIHEKGDAAGLVLDGHLLGEVPGEVNLHELLHVAHREFKEAKIVDELELEKDWPSLRAQLGKAFLNWKNIPSPLPSDGRGEGQGEVRVRPVLKSKIVNRKSEINDLPLWRRRLRH